MIHMLPMGLVLDGTLRTRCEHLKNNRPFLEISFKLTTAKKNLKKMP